MPVRPSHLCVYKSGGFLEKGFSCGAHANNDAVSALDSVPGQKVMPRPSVSDVTAWVGSLEGIEGKQIAGCYALLPVICWRIHVLHPHHHLSTL